MNRRRDATDGPRQDSRNDRHDSPPRSQSVAAALVAAHHRRPEQVRGYDSLCPPPGRDKPGGYDSPHRTYLKSLHGAWAALETEVKRDRSLSSEHTWRQ